MTLAYIKKLDSEHEEYEPIVEPDTLDKFLEQVEDPDHWRKIDQDVILSREELDMIYRIQQNDYADQDFDDYQPYVDFFTGKIQISPVTATPEPKSRFIPSKWEAKKIMKLVSAIRRGLIVSKVQDKPRFYALWGDNDVSNSSLLPPPKMKLPDHSESYNPPPEYLPSKEEIEEFNAMDEEDRPKSFLPQKFSSLRLVPGYSKFIQERFSRCLDLYLCPRVKKNRIQVDPDSLIPKLPDPKDLKPFPTNQAIEYKGHDEPVKSFSVDPNGQWLLSNDSKKVILWEVQSGKEIDSFTFNDPITCVKWSPNRSNLVFIVSSGMNVHLIDPFNTSLEPLQSSQKSMIDWKLDLPGIKATIPHSLDVTQCSWHKKGDYFVSVSGNSNDQKVFVHQISKCQSQTPFKKAQNNIKDIIFHHIKPFLILATDRHVKIFDLLKQELIKTLVLGVNSISSIDIHQQGDHLLVGSMDTKVCWFDIELSDKPYKSLRYHKQAVRSVAFHKRYPLFASASDDGTIHILHGMVYNDMMQNPLLVPLKILKGHKSSKIEFHPTQPWIFSCNGPTITLWS